MSTRLCGSLPSWSFSPGWLAHRTCAFGSQGPTDLSECPRRCGDRKLFVRYTFFYRSKWFFNSLMLMGEEDEREYCQGLSRTLSSRREYKRGHTIDVPAQPITPRRLKSDHWLCFQLILFGGEKGVCQDSKGVEPLTPKAE